MSGELPTDGELIARVRAGDRQAYGPLYERHRSAALRVARIYARDLASAEDLAAEAFTRVLAAIDRGNGPDEAFRPYLYTTLRRTAFDWGESDRRVRLVEDISELEVTAAAINGEDRDPADEAFDRELAARAFTSLPERWQIVLWHLEVEEETPADVAPLLDLSASAVSALAYRAREGLRQAYLQAHLADTVAPSCQPHASRLGAFVRRGLGTRANAAVQRHLDICPSCSALELELVRLNGPLRDLLAPLVFGAGAAVKILASIAIGTATGTALVAGGAVVGAAAGGATAAGGTTVGAAATDATGKGLGIIGRMLLKSKESGKVQAMTVVAVVVAAALAYAALHHKNTAGTVQADPPEVPSATSAPALPPVPSTAPPPTTPPVIPLYPALIRPTTPPTPTPTAPNPAAPLPTTEPPPTCLPELDGDPGDCETAEAPEPSDSPEPRHEAPWPEPTPSESATSDSICVLGTEAAQDPTYENLGLIIAAETDPMCQGSWLQWTLTPGRSPAVQLRPAPRTGS